MRPHLGQALCVVFCAASFCSAQGTEGVEPRSAADSRRAIRTKTGLRVDLVAAEPLVASPVAIDWGADGRLWVCEMFDYPTGADRNWQPGGRVKFLEDADRDGTYDKATVFLDNLPFPTGVTAWGRGVLVCAAPDILYAEDADHDGKADRVTKLFTGFATDNYQARVNSLTLGLDNWIHGANGLLGGVINGVNTKDLDLRNRDFRFRVPDGPMEPVAGLTQQGRVRDDWGRWFGCDNSNALFHYPHDERYARRNPHVPAPPSSVTPPGDYDLGRVYPASRVLERFNDPHAANRLTSACGLGIYRDTLLGDAFYGNAFVCDPVHNLVHRMVLAGDGPTLSRSRAADERESEFLASQDNWFRPVQVRTGPDGALYVVDMYRFLIEHPRWIPAERLARIDVRAGAGMGRIYRVAPEGKPLRAFSDLTKLDDQELAQAIDSPNGTERDRVHTEILARRDARVGPFLAKVGLGAALPQVRIQAVSALGALDALTAQQLTTVLADDDARVRAHALRLCEPILRGQALPQTVEQLAAALVPLVDDPDPAVRRQLALTLGEWRDPRSGKALARLATLDLTDAEMRAGVLSSATHHAGVLLEAIIAAGGDNAPGRDEWVPPLVATAAGSGDDALLAAAFRAVLPPADAPPTSLHFISMAALADALERKEVTVAKFVNGREQLRDAMPRVARVLADAKRVAADAGAPDPMREAAVRLLGRGEADAKELALLCDLATTAGTPDAIRAGAITALRRQSSPAVAEKLLAAWPRTGPTARADVLSLLLGRDEWAVPLLDAVRKGVVRASDVALAERQRLTQHENPTIRELAIVAFPSEPVGSRAEVLDQYRSVGTLTGDPAKGAEVFALNCASCHLLGGTGHAVGPDLAALRGRDVEYLVKNILDPAAVVEPRFTYYTVVLKDRRVLAGVIKSETPAELTIQSGSGVTETVARSAVKEIRASSTSMMPEGVEAAVTPQGMADLIAFVRMASAPAPAATPDEVARDPAAVAKVILDPARSNEAREAAVNANPQFAAQLIELMTAGVDPGSPAEYERIPWIWRVAIACGRRNDAGQIRRVLDASLPKEGGPLRDWQAVVIGGGIINGISERGQWPAKRLAEIIGENDDATKSLRRALQLAGAMADDGKVPAGTRYDALRMLGALPWEESGEHLVRYLKEGTNEELQMGAVSGLADVDAPEAKSALVDALAHLKGRNHDLALDALLRDEPRALALLDAVEKGTLDLASLGDARLKRLAEHESSAVRDRAGKLRKSAAP